MMASIEIFRKGGRYEHCEVLLDGDAHIIVMDNHGNEFIARRATGAWSEVSLQDCIHAIKVRDNVIREAFGFTRAERDAGPR